jgi:Sec-independent protein translocase protein TatA
MAGILAPWHWVTLATVAGVLFLAHKRLPGFGRALGQAVSAFRRAWEQGPRGRSLAKESVPKSYPPSAKASTRQGSPRPPGLLRWLLRDPHGRKFFFWSLLVLGVAYLAWTLADGLVASGSFRSKAVAFLGFLGLGLVLLAVSWLSHRQKGKASGRLDR